MLTVEPSPLVLVKIEEGVWALESCHTDYKGGSRMVNRTLQLFIKVKNEKEIGACYINIGNCYFNEYDANNTLKNYDKGIEYAIKLKDSTNLGVLYNNIGTIYV